MHVYAVYERIRRHRVTNLSTSKMISFPELNMSLEACETFTRLSFDRPVNVLSSAVLNGGFTKASQIINLKVDKHGSSNEAPQISLQKFCDQQCWPGTAVGMMTAASMKSLRHSFLSEQNIALATFVTAGLSNLRRIGDKADQQTISVEEEIEAGTINIILATNADLNTAAMAEALMMVTEAKTAVMQQMNLPSPISGAVASGTGTDSVAIVSTAQALPLQYCGKHVRFGELIGKQVIENVSAAVEACLQSEKDTAAQG